MTTCQYCKNPTHEDLPFCLECRNKIKSMWGGMDGAMAGYNCGSRNAGSRKSWETRREFELRVGGIK